jgi:PAS domain S-box-containing protein
MAWMIAKESGAVAVSDWLAEEAGVMSAERQALVEAFRAHPPISLKLTFRAPRDPFEMAVADPAALADPLFPGRLRLVCETLLDRLPMMIQVIDGAGVVESASQATAELLGYAPEEIVGRQALSLFTEQSRRDVVETVLPRFFASGRLAGVAVQLVGKGGDPVDLRLTAAGDRNEAGRIVRAIAVFAEA